MCGIYGMINTSGDVVSRAPRAARSLRHRGPDAQGHIHEGGVLFGQTLLSIIGDQQVRQPIASADGSVLLVLNGEVYNYLELMAADAELQARCLSRPRSDTVVLVEGLALHGLAFVEKLNGMFAFAYHDRATRKTYLVRDRLGIKPLFHARHRDGVVFASEAHTVRKLADWADDPDPEGFYSYARFRYPIGGRSFDRRIRQLPPGSLLEIAHDGTARERSYWSPLPDETFEGDYEDARATAWRLLRDSVRLRMRSDHGFCTFLSGGLDSSLLTAIACETKGSADTYSIGLAEAPDFDESAHSDNVARFLGTTHHHHPLRAEEYVAEQHELIEQLEEPIGVPNQVALKALSRELAKAHRVVLSGEGADEVFAGYGRIALLYHDWTILQDGGPDSAAASVLRERYGDAARGTFENLLVSRYSYTSHESAVENLSALFPGEDFRAMQDALESELKQTYRRIEGECPYNRLLVFFQIVHLPGLLYRADAASMAHSVEARVPFLDHRLVRFVNSLPFDFKTRALRPLDELQHLTADEISELQNVPKVMLRELGEQLLPREITRRPKLGFPIPDHYYRIDGGRGPGGYHAWVAANLARLKTSDARRTRPSVKTLDLV